MILILTISSFFIWLAVSHQINNKFDDLSDEFWKLDKEFDNCIDCRTKILVDEENIINRQRELLRIKSRCSINWICLMNSGWEKV